MKLFDYEATPNIDRYEPVIFFGLSIYEAMVVVIIGIVPILALPPSGLSFVFAAMTAVAGYLIIKKWDPLGGNSVFVYLLKRWQTRGESITLRRIIVNAQNNEMNWLDADSREVVVRREVR